MVRPPTRSVPTSRGLCDLLSMALAERHPDPTVDTMRLDRILATAMAERLPPQRTVELLDELRYATPSARRSGRHRARQLLAADPEYGEIIEHLLRVAA